MILLEVIKKWEKETTVYLDYMREMKSTDYNIGFADGLESAVQSLKAHLKDCPDVTVEGE